MADGFENICAINIHNRRRGEVAVSERELSA